MVLTTKIAHPVHPPDRHSYRCLPILALILLVLIAAPTQAQPAGRSLFVSPTGSSGNSGSEENPIDLDTALSASGPARPGDTIWLRGGVYERPGVLDSPGDLAVYTSTLTGTAASPIIVRAHTDERVTIDGGRSPGKAVLRVLGAYTWYWGVEITNSHPDRSVPRGAGVDIIGHDNRFINLIVHDVGTGIVLRSAAVADNSEIHGGILFNNGSASSSFGQGHSIHVQHQVGVTRITDNVLFNSFGSGVYAHTETGSLDNLQFARNVAFNHGALSPATGPQANYVVGGGQIAYSPSLHGNYGYYPPGSTSLNADIGTRTP